MWPDFPARLPGRRQGTAHSPEPWSPGTWSPETGSPGTGSPMAWSDSLWQWTQTVQAELDRLAAGLWSQMAELPTMVEGLPPVEVHEEGSHWLVRVSAPGLDPQAVDVVVTPSAVTVRGEQRSRWKVQREGQSALAAGYKAFLRTVPLPEPADPQGARWEYRDGVLEVRVPRRQG